MSNLNSKFDIIKGWPDGSAVAWNFKQKSGIAADLEESEIVMPEDDGSGNAVVDLYQSALGVANNMDHPWIVIQGVDQYDGTESGMTTCLKCRTGFVLKVETSLTDVVAGEMLWADANGVLTNTDPGGNIPALAKVLEADVDEGWMIIES